MAGLLDFLQSASNTAASNVSAPVDGLAWLLRKAGLDVGEPVGGSDWMQRQGLTRPVEQSGASLAGETMGLLAPMAAAAKAPQIAKGLLQAGENAMTPTTLSKEAGALIPNWKENVNRALDAVERGDRIGKVPVAILEDRQFTGLNNLRLEAGLPELSTPNVDYIGRHHHASRLAQGDSRSEILSQIESGLSQASEVVRHPRGPALQNPAYRINERGEFVNDRAVIQGAPGKFTELFSVYGKTKK